MRYLIKFTYGNYPDKYLVGISPLGLETDEDRENAEKFSERDGKLKILQIMQDNKISRKYISLETIEEQNVKTPKTGGRLNFPFRIMDIGRHILKI